MNALQPTKFKAAGRDWPYQVEFIRENPNSHETEGLRLSTGAEPRPMLVQRMGDVLKIALRFHGLGLIVYALEAEQMVPGSQGIGVGFSSITWSDGDSAGSRVEIYLHSRTQVEAEFKPVATTKMNLPKVDITEERVWVGDGPDKRLILPPGSLKNEYNRLVSELRMLVQGYADGETAQLELIPRAEHA